ncbi:polysaccharide deacetylase family protein [Streptomyces sp. NL15-2K]|uniref:polysaccharide deacetylase family protein n=1 Tax=Streptomyces sp. NL15-2K TaxID=376149 RepID=UPI000FFA1E00|nr:MULTISPECIES: polysaccharide deacetylase family protein [Actinomycetes]WKX13344.1 polysaccharide deacetylase family protein [Kutzneria buriramensis]GCB45284.1 polysaccharide deacetylase-like protein [Streptomyces sp. NL15-2K]
MSKKQHRGRDGALSRRAALLMGGTGGVALAGGGAWLGSVAAQPAAAPAAAEAAIGGLTTPPAYAPSGRRPKHRRATWSQQFQASHGWTPGGTGTASAEANDTSAFVRGTQSVRVTTNGTGKQSYVRKTGMTALNLTNKMIRLVLRVDDVTNLSKLVFYLGSGSLANHFAWTFHAHSKTAANYVQSGEWVTVHLQWADVTSAAGTYSLSASGTPSTKTGFTDMSFAVYDNAGGPVTYRLQAVEVIPDTATVFPKGVVSITFDDSHKSVHDLARPVMDQFGYSGTVYNIADAIGTGSFLTVGQMRSMQDYSGWEMAGHSYANATHTASYPKLTAEQADDDFRKLREWLVGNGFSSEHFAYPHGAFQKTSDGVPVDLIASRHFTTARSIISETIESFAPAMPYRLKALTGINDGTGIGGTALSKVTGAGGRLDRCANSGDWLILCLHKVVDGAPATSTEIGKAGLAALMKAIDDRGIQVLTVEEAMAYYT